MKSLLQKINTFMNSERGAGHGISQGMFYGVLFLAFAWAPLWFAVILMTVNHARVAVQELYIEGWLYHYKVRKAKGDFWFDCLFRPLQTDVVFLGFGYLPKEFWPLIVVLTLIVGFKKKNEWPLLMFWK